MTTAHRIEQQIQEIRDAFDPDRLHGSRKEVLEALGEFESKTRGYLNHTALAAIIKWHKNLYLQQTCNYTRSEELLEEALTILETIDQPEFQRWRLKIYLSLGYNHRAQRNYLDAGFYLDEALNISLSDPDLAKFQGEIYSLLASVNLSLNHYHKAIKYVAHEKEKAHALYRGDTSLALIYAYALYDYCKVTRLIGGGDLCAEAYLNEAISLFQKASYSIGLLKAQLELAQWELKRKSLDQALDHAALLEQRFTEIGRDSERLETGLLIARIHETMYDYEQAEIKLEALVQLAREKGLASEQIMADILFEKGTIFSSYNLDREAFECFRESAKIGMALGTKSNIIRAFNAAKRINPYPAREFITSDLVYQDSCFVRDRLKQNTTPFYSSKTRVKLVASTLFLDIAGFSSIMRRSSEDMTVTMIDELIDRLCLIIYQNGGYIDKFLGDGFMAIFEHGQALNANVAFGAVRAGMDILRALNHKNRKLKKAYGVNSAIKIRMGLSSGEIYAIVLGNYIKREYSYLGNSINLASKLEGLAAKHPMLIDQITFNLVSKRVMAQREEVHITDMGKVAAYHVIRLSRQSERKDTAST